MRGLLAVFRREFGERRAVLWAAAVMSLVPVVVPVIRGLGGVDTVQTRSSIAFLLAAAFGLGLAVALGASMLVPRIANRRIAFDLSRPVSGSAIWVACVASATALAACSAGIAVLPAWLAGSAPHLSDLWAEPLPPWVLLLAALLGVPVIFSLLHFVALAFRSRWRLALDAALAAAVGLLLFAALSRLPSFFAPLPAAYVAAGLTMAAVVALLWAGNQSVTRGRTDVSQAHRAASRSLWMVLGAAGVLANGYAIWVMSAGPSDVAANGFWFGPADEGPWIEISGQARGARAEFLYDTATGRFERTRTVDWRGPVLSGNGKRAAWVEGGDGGPPSHPLRILALDDPSAKPVATRLLIEGYPSLLELSEDGSRLATWGNGVLAVHDVVSERTLASAKVPVGDQEELRGLFVGPDVFRAYRVGDRAIEILQMDAGTRKLERLGKIEGLVGRYFVTDASGSRLLKVGRGIHLYDGATGALLATLADEAHRLRWPWLLPDGRIVMTEDASRLRVFDPDGRDQSTIALPPDCSAGHAVSKVLIGGEVAPDRLVVGCTDDSAKRAIWLADLRDGSIRKVTDGLSPAWAFGARPALGSEATKLFYGPDQRSLVHFDPLTGERRTLLGKP
jgi:hypothetical protein